VERDDVRDVRLHETQRPITGLGPEVVNGPTMPASCGTSCPYADPLRIVRTEADERDGGVLA
jgi:hypothetical protein